VEADDIPIPAWYEAVYAAARQVPAGRVASYGQLGDLAGVTARMAGRAVWEVPEGVPWWRIVGSDGALRIAKRDPALAKRQREQLEAEGVRLSDAGRVESRFFIDE
jgi:methylated-DNA-protein-cysteine methyltransferase related protein